MVPEGHFAALKILPGKVLNGGSLLAADWDVGWGWPWGTSGGWAWVVLEMSLGPGTQEAWARGRLAPMGWVRPSQGNLGREDKIPPTHSEETLHFFSFGDCQCDSLQQWKGSVCNWRKRERVPEMQSEEGDVGGSPGEGGPGWDRDGEGGPKE